MSERKFESSRTVLNSSKKGAIELFVPASSDWSTFNACTWQMPARSAIGSRNCSNLVGIHLLIEGSKKVQKVIHFMKRTPFLTNCSFACWTSSASKECTGFDLSGFVAHALMVTSLPNAAKMAADSSTSGWSSCSQQKIVFPGLYSRQKISSLKHTNSW